MDRILVLADGAVVEYDAPETLLQNRAGGLCAMVRPECPKLLTIIARHRSLNRALPPLLTRAWPLPTGGRPGAGGCGGAAQEGGRAGGRGGRRRGAGGGGAGGGAGGRRAAVSSAVGGRQRYWAVILSSAERSPCSIAT
jgi:hypothetical protein